MKKDVIKIGCSAFIFNKVMPTSVLLIKRESEPFLNKWSFPGGHLNFGESIDSGIKREILEELGYEIQKIPNLPYNIEEFIKIDRHYIVISGGYILGQRIVQ